MRQRKMYYIETYESWRVAERILINGIWSSWETIADDVTKEEAIQIIKMGD